MANIIDFIIKKGIINSIVFFIGVIASLKSGILYDSIVGFSLGFLWTNYSSKNENLEKDKKIKKRNFRKANYRK